MTRAVAPDMHEDRSREDAHLREAATREILDLISRSREDAGPVFDAILHRAAELCDAYAAGLIMGKAGDSHLRMVAHYGMNPATVAVFDRGAVPMDPETSFTARAILTGKTIHVEDMMDTESFRRGVGHTVSVVKDSGIRTNLLVPLVTPSGGIGAFIIFRKEVRPYTAEQIALVETFAAQAVIAIENVRQFRELQDRLEREAATRNILRVISESPDDEQPTFEAILDSATRLCGTPYASIVLGRSGDAVQTMVAHRGAMDETVAVFRAGKVPMNPEDSIAARAILEGRTIHVPDMADTDQYRAGHARFRLVVDQQGLRTNLFVPLMGPEGAIGCFILWKKEVAPFTADQIALMETFASHAVIAIENVRQFRELQDSLEQQKATSDILRVISQSREDEKQVFDLIVEKAAVLCDADQGGLVIVNEARTHVRLMADWGHNRTAWKPGAEFSVDLPLPIMATIRTAQVVHIEDYAQSDAYKDRDPIAVGLVETEGHRTRLIVPLLQNGIAIGCISLSRRVVRPFTPDEIALVETFAAQAVIAIENVRQFRELQARLEREAATRDILEVISQSRDDDTPVFDAILRSAARLCRSPMAWLLLADDARTTLKLAGYHGDNRRAIEIGDEWPLDPDADPKTGLGGAHDDGVLRAILEARTIQDEDMALTPHYLAGDAAMRQLVDEEGLRTRLCVPLVSGGKGIGIIVLSRREVAPFGPQDIALLDTFAEQAVIAIENVRQFRELQARLEREAATRDILEVISQNRDDDRPVFDVIAQSAARLCGAPVCTFWRVENGIIYYCASHGLTGKGLAETELTAPEPLADNSMAGRVFRARAVCRIDDATDESYLDHAWVRARGLKYIIGVPIFVGGEVWGCINPMWPPDRPPRNEDIQLVESFAAQAAIAIENVRQFKALERLNAELGDRVQDQVGEIERMGRLKRFLPAAVADAVVTSGSERMLKSHRALLGVLFCDIRGFTAFCETAEPEETIEVLQTYHEEMGRLIEAHGAGVDHRMGDGIMVLFNDPLPCDDPAGQAVRLAMAMRARMAELCAKWKKMGYRLGFGVGIALGYATVGMVGSGGRFDYTASGTAVNLASRLADEAQDGEILLSPRAATAVEDTFVLESKGETTFKGIREPVEVFRVA